MNRDPNQNPSQETFVQWFFRVWTQAFFRLLGANMLFIIACLPVVTIPAALCGLHAVVQNFYRDKYENTVFSTFRREFKESFCARTLIVFGILSIPTAAFALLDGIGQSAMLLVLSALLLAAALVVLSWFVPQLVLLNLRPVKALKNSLIFMCIETKRNFLIMLIHGVCLSVMVYLLPLSVFFLLILPVLHVVVITPVVVPALMRYLVNQTED